jgi:hypothetical protein
LLLLSTLMTAEGLLPVGFLQLLQRSRWLLRVLRCCC